MNNIFLLEQVIIKGLSCMVKESYRTITIELYELNDSFMVQGIIEGNRVIGQVFYPDYKTALKEYRNRVKSEL